MKANRFARGSGAYKCNVCSRLTRSTGRGDNELVSLCAICYDLAGEENHLSDTGELYDSPENILGMIAFITTKGDASHWDELKKKAQEIVQQDKILELMMNSSCQPSSSTV